MLAQYVSKSPGLSSGLIELISRSIEEHGHCTIHDRKLLGLVCGTAQTVETKMRRLRLFACQHDWAVTSHLGHAAVFTRSLKYLAPVMGIAVHE